MFKISIVPQKPVWDSLPVAKLKYYPLEPRDYMPLVQAGLCLNSEGFFLHFLSFELNPTPTSIVMAAFNLCPQESGRYFTVSVNPEDEISVRVYEDGRELTEFHDDGGVTARAYRGEDLRGDYWGATIDIGADFLRRVYGRYEPTVGAPISGNLFKVDTAPGSTHYGCYYLTDFMAEDWYGPSHYGDFEMSSY